MAVEKTEPSLPLLKVYLEKQIMGQEWSLSEGLLDPKVFLDRDGWFPHQYRAGIRGFLWGKTIEEFEIKYPSDWWQAFKERWSPRWALRRWPVQYERKNIKLTAYWPTFRVMVPDHEPRLVLTLNGSPEGGYSGEPPDVSP